MATQYYLKLYHEMLDDWKVLSLPDDLKWRFVQCLLVAGELDEDGWLPEIRQFASRIRPMNPKELQSDLEALANVELVELRQYDDGCERWFVPKFEKRQQRSANAKRQADWRQREKEKKEAKKRKEIKEDIDIDTRNVTRNESNVTNNVTSNENTYTYTDHEENQAIKDVASKIAMVVKEPYAPGVNEEQFENAAGIIMGWGEVGSIDGFGKWWESNGHYKGKPALKSFLNEFQNYLSGVTISPAPSSNGQQSKQDKAQAILAIVGRWGRRRYRDAVPDLKEAGLLDLVPGDKWVQFCDAKPDQIQWMI